LLLFRQVAGRWRSGWPTENVDTSSVPDAIWLTLDERRGFGLPRHLVIVADTGMGGFYVCECRPRPWFESGVGGRSWSATGLDVGPQRLAKGGRVSRGQVDFVGSAVEAEGDRFALAGRDLQVGTCSKTYAMCRSSCCA
jgi:hypothetical protein